MVSFSSSVINKSRKKFAPKAPVRRAGAASTPASSARPSIERQTASQTPQPPPSVPSTAPAQETTSTTPTIAPTQPSAPPQDAGSAAKQSPPVIQVTSKPTAVAIPLLKRPEPSNPPVDQPSTTRAQGPVPVSIPRQRPVESISTIPVRPTPTVARAAPPTPPSTQLIRPQTAETNTQNVGPEEPDQLDTRPAKRPRLSATSIPIPSSRSTTTASSSAAPEPPQSAPAQPSQDIDDKSAKRIPKKKAPKTTTKVKKSADEEAADIVAAATEKKPRARRKRVATPENAESIEIVPTTVKMSDLCKDLRTGRKSKREIELQSMDWTEIARKKKEREERQKLDGKSADATPDREAKRDTAELASLGGPQMRIVNGEIVLDASSLQIDRHADAARNAEDMEEVEENPLTRRINAASFGRRTKVEIWDEELTDLFYRGLRMFGTDFMMISKMFPGRSRRQIKLKFSNEERRDPQRIKDTLLGPRELVDMEDYSQMTNTVYDDPRVIQRELDEEKKRLEDEHAKEKEAREQMMKNSGRSSTDANVLPSIEGGGQGASQRSVKAERKKRGVTAAGYGGGSEEILGSIDDLGIAA
ncbi:hypothetical protein AJ80_08724 [Polytolypa hystricis UAMH7299]|uniref:Myb-like domain-containing protein n=1 Tax=Polytolypa hystricis (strain UAMH7299) TaxID=1447883 RepID=A0A2B7X3K0_POLH7|nr:hypothetical protein AJ80_08724 [Polytolypa hystricis UAMH7299]